MGKHLYLFSPSSQQHLLLMVFRLYIVQMYLDVIFHHIHEYSCNYLIRLGMLIHLVH